MALVDGIRYRSRMELAPFKCDNCPAHAMAFCSDESGLSLARLDRSVRRIRLSKDQLAAEEGEPGPPLLTVISGALRLFKILRDGRRQVTGFRAAGEIVIAPPRGLPSPVSIQAIAPTVLCVLDLDDLDKLRQERPGLGRRLDELVARRAIADQEHMLTLGRKSPVEKLATFLLEMSRRAPLSGAGEDAIALPMPRQDIADYLGLESETTSRCFTRFKQSDMIALPRPNRVVLRDPAALKALASGQRAAPTQAFTRRENGGKAGISSFA